MPADARTHHAPPAHAPHLTTPAPVPPFLLPPPRRYQKFYSLTRPDNAYRNLLSPDDQAMVPLLSAFQRLAVYKRVELPASALRGQALYDYYNGLIAKYIGGDRLYW